MNKKDWYKSLSLADDKFIAEAHPDNKKKPQTLKIVAASFVACACLTIVFCGVWLFYPFYNSPPSVVEYSGSEYYGIIKALNKFTHEQPGYKNNMEKYLDKFKLYTNGADDITDGTWGSQHYGNESVDDGYLLGGSNSLRGEEKYEEITDNQVDGIIEADRIKRSDKYIYYLDDNTLRIYSIDKENTKEVGNYTIGTEDAKTYCREEEFFLSADCKAATVIYTKGTESSISSNSYYYKHNAVVVSLDVSDPTKITKKNEVSVSGSYGSSRITDGSILLFTQEHIFEKSIDFSDETTFIPQITDKNGSYCISPENIVAPKDINSTYYFMITKLDEKSLEVEGTRAYLSYSKEPYVSENNIFLFRQYEKKGTPNDTTMTEISCLDYSGDELETKGSVTVNGYIKDKWSVDEYEGILRVVATTRTSVYKKEMVNNNSTMDGYWITRATTTTNASLYCVDLSKFKVVASVEEFAPKNEVVQSVRFDKQTAYVCTSIELSDPVFFFDLSDLKNITYKDTGTIEGFSSSLINLGDGYLLGIGRGNRWDDFKVEVYKEAEDGVKSVCSYELENVSFSTDYKSYYIDRENQLIGLGIYDYNNYQNTRSTGYILLQFDNQKLIELVKVALDGSLDNMRGVYIDGYMYMFGKNDFKVEKVFK